MYRISIYFKEKLKNTMKKIISVSRRTDIPAYYADWFYNRLKVGYVYYPNPFSKKPIYTNLRPEAVTAFVFWTRNPYPLLKYLNYIDDNYNKAHYMHITINGQPKELEIRNPKLDFVINTVEYLAKRYGKHYVQWRFDPIILSSITTELYIYDKFYELAKILSPMVNKCITSFVDFYEKTKQNFYQAYREKQIQFYEPSIEKQISILKNLKKIADEFNLTLEICTESTLTDKIDIKSTSCIDLNLIKYIVKDDFLCYDKKPTREGCLCYDAKDIGYFNSCPHGCIYCYANKNPEEAFQNSKFYRKNSFDFDNLKEPEIENSLFDDLQNSNNL